MTKRMRRWIALLLTLALSMSLLPGAALAAEAEDEADSQVAVAAESETETGEAAFASEAVEDTAESSSPELAAAVDADEEEEEEVRIPEEVEESEEDRALDEQFDQVPVQDEDETDDGGIVEIQSEQQEEESTLYASGSTVAPGAGIQYSQSGSVTKGTIRYVSQNTGNKLYHADYWGKWAGSKTKVYCKSANVSMMLSYLGINLLPKDIMAKRSDNNCMYYDYGGAKAVTHKSGLTFAKAMDNYVNGGGLFSPVMIRLKHDAYATKQHYVIVVGKIDDNTYQVLDTFNRGFYENDGIWTMKVKGNNITQFYKKNKAYSTVFTEIFQYHIDQKTLLTNYNKPGNRFQGSGFAPKGKFYGSKDIASVTVGVYDRLGNRQAGCYKKVAPNSVGYDLSKLSGSIHLDQLKPGFYRYVVEATNAGGSAQTYVSTLFTVLSKKRTVSDATFYLDNSCNIKYCAVPAKKANGNNVDMVITRNKENPYMRFRADYVGKGYYTLTVVGSGKLLTVYKSRKTSGTRVIQNKLVERPGQYWQILPNGAGRFYLVPQSAPGCCLTLTGGTVSEGTPLQIRTAAQSTEQTWLMRPTRPLLTKLRNTTAGLQVQWGTVPNATGYRVERKSTKDTAWKQVGTVKKGKTGSWTDTTAKNGGSYFYRVRTLFGKSMESPGCPAKQLLRLSALKVSKPKSKRRGKITVTWKANGKATKYQVAVSRKASKRPAKIHIVSGKTTHLNVSNLARNKIYYVRVRAVRTVGGKTYYSPWSSRRAVRVHK